MVEKKESLIGRGLTSHQDTHDLVLGSQVQRSQTMFECPNGGEFLSSRVSWSLLWTILTVRKGLK